MGKTAIIEKKATKGINASVNDEVQELQNQEQ